MKLIWLGFLLQVIIAAGCCYGMFVFLNDYLAKKAWFLKLVGIDVLDFDSSDIEVLSKDIREAIDNYLNDYNTTKAPILSIPLHKLSSEFDYALDDEFIAKFIEESVELDQRIELFDVVDGYLLLALDSAALKEACEKQESVWRAEGQLERIEYHKNLMA